MKFSVTILGCKVNAYEAEAAAAELSGRGFTRVDPSEPADISVVYTCAVTNTAGQKSRQMIRRGKRLNPGCITAVAGCYSQIASEMVEDAEIIIGTSNKHKLPDYIEEYIRTGEKIIDVQKEVKNEFELLTTDHFETHTRAYLKIEDGCNQFCAYCVIPFARGRERSMAPDQVIAEVKRLSAHHPEIVLTGIHTGRYGREYGVTLSQMIRRILAEDSSLQRLRISSIEISEIDDDLLAVMAEDPRIARHLHIPLQAGSDHILQLMGRPYTTDEYLKRIEEIREKIPGISISTDLIVGFPGETDEDFADTLTFLKACRFSFLHVFPFSLRSGTRAEQMPDHIDSKTKKERAGICLSLSEKLYDEYKKQWLGRSAYVIAERSEGGDVLGHTSEYLPVRIRTQAERGEYIRVKITGLQDHEICAERM